MSKKVEKKVANPVNKEVAKVAEKAVKKDEKIDMVKVNVTLNELKGLVDFALHARFFLLTLVPPQKKGSRGERILKGVDDAGPVICNIGERLGMKFDEKKNCKCNECKCGKKTDDKKPVEKKPVEKKPVEKKAEVKKPLAKTVNKPAKK